MSNQNCSNLTIKEAKQILDSFSCTQVKTVESEAEKEQLRKAILLITNLSESENLGICADNSDQGFAALSSYLKALGYECRSNLSSSYMEQPVYIKYNTQKMSHFLDYYSGDYRGVLISCQAEDDEINGVYGYFPLDIFK